MFDLEQAVQNWRQQMEANRTVGRSALDELEDHVREDFAALVRAGRSEPDAWSAAVTRLGEPVMIRREFAKVDRLPTFDRWTFAVLLTTASALGVFAFAAIFFMRGQVMRNQPVLTVHIITITYGYLAGLFAAVIATYGTMRGYFSSTPIPALTDFTLRLVRAASITAAALTLLGFAFGAIWANDAWGRPFTMDPREIGALIVIASFIATALVTLRTTIPARVALALAIAAGATVLAAWLGTAAHANHYPPLLTFLTVTGLAVTLGLATLSLRMRNDVAIR